MPWPGLHHQSSNCLQVNCGCPSPTKDQKRPSFLSGKPEDRTFPSPARPEDDRFNLEGPNSQESDLVNSLQRYRRILNIAEEAASGSPERVTDEDKSSPGRYSASPRSNGSLDRPNSSVTVTSAPVTSGVAGNFSVQSLATSSPRGQHVI